MASDPALEVDAFVRWLATSPHKLEEYALDPAGFLEAANVGQEARPVIMAYGVNGLRQLVKETAGQIYADPEGGIVQRDESVRGFGARPSGDG